MVHDTLVMCSLCIWLYYFSWLLSTPAYLGRLNPFLDPSKGQQYFKVLLQAVFQTVLGYCQDDSPIKALGKRRGQSVTVGDLLHVITSCWLMLTSSGRQHIINILSLLQGKTVAGINYMHTNTRYNKSLGCSLFPPILFTAAIYYLQTKNRRTKGFMEAHLLR